MTRAENRELMTGFIEQWRISGQTQKEFCEKEGLSLSKFRYWIGRNRESEAGILSSFVEVEPFAMSSGITIRYPGGKEIILPVQTSIRHIKELLNL